MAKFKKGDVVRVIQTHLGVRLGDVLTINQNNSFVPYAMKDGSEFVVNEDRVVLVSKWKDPYTLCDHGNPAELNCRSCDTTAQDRKATPVWSGVLAYFPKTMRALARVSFKGSKQHHPDKEMHWDRNKSNDHLDCHMRHLLDSGADYTNRDSDGELHVVKAAWRMNAFTETVLEGQNDADQEAKPD